MAELNPDGVSVKGCSIIYAPAGQAGEYSALATNPYRGCGHQQNAHYSFPEGGDRVKADGRLLDGREWNEFPMPRVV